MPEGPLIGAFNATLTRLRAIDDEVAKLDVSRAELAQERAALLHDLAKARAVLAHIGAPYVAQADEERVEPSDLPRVRRRPIRRTSSVGAALKVLRQANRPMHINELMKMIEHMTGLAVHKTTLVSGLARYVRAGDTFRRTAANTYDLIPSDEEGIRLVG